MVLRRIEKPRRLNNRARSRSAATKARPRRSKRRHVGIQRRCAAAGVMPSPISLRNRPSGEIYCEDLPLTKRSKSPISCRVAFFLGLRWRSPRPAAPSTSISEVEQRVGADAFDGLAQRRGVGPAARDRQAPSARIASGSKGPRVEGAATSWMSLNSIGSASRGGSPRRLSVSLR